MIYLMIKEHRSTGLKYLCKHVSDNRGSCYKYKGSGTRWKNHLRVHGDDIRTTIIFETHDKEIFKNTAIGYSIYFDVVNSKNWANLIEESGQGGRTKDSEFYSNIAKKLWSNPENREKLTNRLSNVTQPKGIIASRLKRLGIPLTDEHKEKLKGKRPHVDYTQNNWSRNITTPFGIFGSIREASRNIKGYTYKMIWDRLQKNNEWRYI